MSCGRLGAVLCLLGFAACSKSTPPPPVVGTPPSTTERVTGSERLGWDQTALDATELATFKYAIYVDGVRSEATGVSCTASTATAFVCTSRLPAMSAGDRAIEIAAFIVDGATLESARSGTLRVTVVTAITASAGPVPGWPSDFTLTTADGGHLKLELIANGLNHPTDMAFSADGRLFVTEQAGRVRIVSGGRLLEEPALVLGAGQTLVALALDPSFDRTHLVYTIGVSPRAGGQPAFWLARFREALGTLADRAVLLDDIPASPAAAASLRFGPDGKLYAAFDNGGDERAGGDLAEFGGKVLRLNADGTTPADQAGTTPVYAFAFRSPRGIDWDPVSQTLWVADRLADGSARLSPVTGSSAGPKTRGTIRGAYALPQTARPSSIAFSRGRVGSTLAGSLLVASEEGQRLLRLKIDAGNPTRLASTENLLESPVGGIRVVSFGPDGSIYFCTATAIGRLVP